MSHQNHINYMSGVPVKISENYKPPKKIAITQSVAQRLANPSATVQLLATTYDFTLERTVLAKMSEWQHVRAQENCDRKERMRLRMQEHQKQLDAKQKQMLTAVSYPSADDFSSDDDRDEDNSNASSSKSKMSSTQLNSVPNSSTANTVHTAAASATVAQQFSPPNYFDSILVPTIMPGQYGKNGGTVLTPCNTKINYSDFENDTSSPFDNVELKTINDLDILAEVLNTSATIQDEQQPTKKSTKNDLPRSTTPVASQQNIQNHNSVYAQQAPSPQQTYQLNQTYASYYEHSAYGQSNFNNVINQQAITMQYHPTEYNTSASIVDTKPKIGQYFYSTINANPYSTSINNHSVHQNPYIRNNYYNNANYDASTVVGVAHVYTGPIDHCQPTPTVIENPMPNKSKSKSVPDIMQEINDELKNSERKRARNNSQCSTSPADESSSQSSSSTTTSMAIEKSKEPQKSHPKRSSLYHSLSESSQTLATNISLMGFPLERVARITEKFGRDDKKVNGVETWKSYKIHLGFIVNVHSPSLSNCRLWSI